jgi:hypothetical protein
VRCKAKYSVKLADLFQEVFQYLPLAIGARGEGLRGARRAVFSSDGVTLGRPA